MSADLFVTRIAADVVLSAKGIRTTAIAAEVVAKWKYPSVRATAVAADVVAKPPASNIRATTLALEVVVKRYVAPIVTTDDFAPQLVLVGHLDAVPSPLFVSLVQVGGYVKAIAALPQTSGNELLAVLRLYRAPSALGPWTRVYTANASPISTLNNLFDLDPGIGHLNFYAVTVANAIGTESPQSAPLSIAPQAT